MVLGSLILFSLLPIQQNQPLPPTEAEIQEATAYGMQIAQWQNLPVASFRNRDRIYFKSSTRGWIVHYSNGSITVDERSRKLSEVSFHGLGIKPLLVPITLEASRARVTELSRFLFPGRSMYFGPGIAGEDNRYRFAFSFLRDGFQVVSPYNGDVSFDGKAGFIREIRLPTEPASYGDSTVGITMAQAKAIAIAKAKLRKPGDYFCREGQGFYFKNLDIKEIESIIHADWRTQQDMLDAEQNKAILVYEISVVRRPDENGKGATGWGYVIEAKTGRVLYETK